MYTTCLVRVLAVSCRVSHLQFGDDFVADMMHKDFTGSLHALVRLH
jgi:hypothetical protein